MVNKAQSKRSFHHQAKVKIFCSSLIIIGTILSIAFYSNAKSDQNNSSQKSKPKLVTITTQQWAPYHSQERDTQGVAHESGYGLTALDCVMAKIGQPYRVIFLPWGRAQNSVKQGKYDAFFSASRNEWRDQFAVLSNTFIQQEWNFYYHKNYRIPASMNEQKSNTVFGARIHSNSAHWLAKNKFKRVKTFPTISELVKLLDAKRIDGVMENALLFEAQVRQSQLSLDAFVKRPNMRIDLGVYFGKTFLAKHPGFLERFNRHTQACRFDYQ
ncbi:substrate-binding periplasmic protein [Shewanella aquimarina]|uniref:substrate-binding periplasmic protein n=1 Tax=Shewanella aquimarina TaxID=260365 RepID=UPI002014B7F6|nr:transporter substrate-binding domain-containing protein [Shewanella aquimarina]MCL2909470.1 transporter substrate-binding domain-containing protein [Shewanella aquimarina]